MPVVTVLAGAGILGYASSPLIGSFAIQFIFSNSHDSSPLALMCFGAIATVAIMVGLLLARKARGREIGWSYYVPPAIIVLAVFALFVSAAAKQANEFEARQRFELEARELARKMQDPTFLVNLKPPLSLATRMFVVGALNNGERVVGTPLTSAEVHAVLTNLDSDSLIEDAVAGCRETDANDLQWLSEHGRKLARESLAHNPSTPDGVLRHLMEDPDPDVQFWTGYSVALNVCNPKMLRTFWERESNKAQRKDGNAFYRLATNACTPNDVLELLADYPGDVGPQAKAAMQAYSTKTTGHRIANKH